MPGTSRFKIPEELPTDVAVFIELLEIVRKGVTAVGVGNRVDTDGSG